MNLYKRLILPFLILSITLFLWKPTDAVACSCIMPPPPDQALNEANAVFSGEVIEITDNMKLINGNGRTVKFKVDESWKGIESGEVAITTGNNEADCGFPFEVGQSYLVYASSNGMYDSKSLTTSICNRTVQLANATEDLKVFGEGEKIDTVAEEVGVNRSWIVWIGVFVIVILLGTATVYFRNKEARR
ncbi:hypothetical protein H9649_07315 [Sporosarcina sp. Sa2YVA2]|uniref:Cobalamin biosynthesis protein CbiN n=1 Tax=Sporosarcina quadrami TaxID=2762234 RepID=A0ABR8U8M6_9BACL|nr:hypothetical protein [Sporosarcina quadrami]MBD7984383.1 hypothetical protein [Sporosarcina quadrami]